MDYVISKLIFGCLNETRSGGKRINLKVIKDNFIYLYIIKMAKIFYETVGEQSRKDPPTVREEENIKKTRNQKPETSQ